MAICIETLAIAKKFAKSYTDEAIAMLPNGIVYRGAVPYKKDLPNTAEIGDAYTVQYKGTSGTAISGTEYVWGAYEDMFVWIELGPDMDQYQEKLESGENIKTINGQSILGSGDISTEAVWQPVTSPT